MYPETRYCNACGHAVDFRVPPGDHLPRHVCPSCGHIQYRNPKVIVGVVPEWEDGRILMCRRNIEPRLGLWTFPAGFLEQGETSAAGAAREAREESLAEVDVGHLLMVINVPYVSQVYMIHCGRLLSPHYGATPESSEVVLMREDEIPWDDIAFPTIWHSLRHYFEDRRRGSFGTHVLDLTQRPRPPRRPEVPGDDPAAS
ncbi:MAG: NUDIX hydrolase [Gammaproteobacteria bacterium]|jgi:ADP-ribose pyrophosphatase YjhB (NUDIX family)